MLLWLLFDITTGDGTLSPLADGLMVRKIDDVRSRVADWRVLVVLDAPGNVNLGPALEATYGAISARSDGLHSETIQNWFDRLDLVRGSVKTGLLETAR